MTVRASVFTPETLLSAPRRSAGVPNADGSLVLYTTTAYSFSEHVQVSEARLLDSATQESRLLTDQEAFSEPNWLDGDEIILLQSGDKGVTHVIVADANDFSARYRAGTIDAQASNLKVKKLGDGTYMIAVSAKASPDDKLYNPEKAVKPHSSAKHYQHIFVRHWDTYITSERNAIWLSTLSKEEHSGRSGRYTLSALVNALEHDGLESPIPPFGGTDHFDFGLGGLAFVAKDPSLNAALNTHCNLYFTPITFSGTTTGVKPQKLSHDGFDGAASSPVLSPDGSKAAFLQMRKNGYEADKNHIFLIPNLHKPLEIRHLLTGKDGKERWDMSPQRLCFGRSGLFIVAEYKGRELLYYLPLNESDEDVLPKQLTEEGSISDIKLLASGEAFISGSSLVDNSYYKVVDSSASASLVSSASRSGSKFGLSMSQVSEIWFPGATIDGAQPYHVHAWVFKPSYFSSKKKYPLAFLIHGGPQSAWTDSWSTRWNPAVFAEQGYVVVTPNPTGSTGYGQAFVDGITKQWGGRPYEDLVSGFDWIEKNLEYVDTKRAVALGASYGGYMINWIQGHDFGRKFKALVCHDGVFSMASQMASEELWFPYNDLGGPYWKNKEEWEKWDPLRFTEHWATPQLVIHNELDYRLTMAEGLSAFNVLQTKGIESEFLTFPDENHFVLKPENSLVWHTVILNFINKFVGLPPYRKEDS